MVSHAATNPTRNPAMYTTECLMLVAKEIGCDFITRRIAMGWEWAGDRFRPIHAPFPACFGEGQVACITRMSEKHKREITLARYRYAGNDSWVPLVSPNPLTGLAMAFKMQGI